MSMAGPTPTPARDPDRTVTSSSNATRNSGPCDVPRPPRARDHHEAGESLTALRPCGSAVSGLRCLAPLAVVDDATRRRVVGRPGLGSQPEPGIEPARGQATVGQGRCERAALLAGVGAVGVRAATSQDFDVLERLLHTLTGADDRQGPHPR